MAYMHNPELVDEILNPWFKGTGFMPWLKHMARYWVKGFKLAMPVYITVFVTSTGTV
jgi:hypothetical protein